MLSIEGRLEMFVLLMLTNSPAKPKSSDPILEGVAAQLMEYPSPGESESYIDR